MLKLILLAAILHRPSDYVAAIYQATAVEPLTAVSLVESEAWFNPRAVHLNWNKDHTQVLSSDWGLWQLNSRWHPQFRDDLRAHVEYGAWNFSRVVVGARFDLRAAIATYNTGNPLSPAGLAWADQVLLLKGRLGGRVAHLGEHVTDAVAALLGEILVISPATGSRLLKKEEAHRLLELTGGSVLLQRKVWQIVLRRHGRLHVRVELRVE